MNLMRAAALAIMATAAAMPAAVMAVQSVNVEHKTTEDFQDGTFDNTVVNNFGELKLSRKLEALLKGDKEVAFVNALAADGRGMVYAATGPAGKLFRITPAGECELYYQAKEKTLQSLAVGPGNELYLGTGGGEGRIYRVVGKNTAQLVLDKPGLAYVWAMVVLPDGRLVAGTGPAGELILVTPDGKPSAGEVLFKSQNAKQKNILSVTANGGKTIYFGTDTDGLIFKYDLATRKPFLLYDADEAEIACLALGPDGALYAGTADPRQAGEGGPAPSGVDGRPATQPLPSGAPGPTEPPPGEDQNESSPGDHASNQPSSPGEPGQSRAPAGDAVLPIGLNSPGMSAAAGSDATPGQPQERDTTGPSTRPEQPGAGKVPSTRPDRASPARQPQPAQDGPPAAMVARMRAAMAGRPGRPPEGGPAGGNAVYRIEPDGAVTEVLRQPTMMLSLLLRDRQLVVGTGTDGRVLAISPGSEEIATLARPRDVKQVLALAAGRDGVIYIGTANEGLVGRIGTGYSPRGTFTSKTIDARHISRWGVIREQSKVPQGTSVRVQTRTGNLAEPDDALWSPWSAPTWAAEPMPVGSPSARFIQYQVILSADRDDATPVVNSVTVSYVNENQPPKVHSAKAVVPGATGGGEDGEGGPPRSVPSMPPGIMRGPVARPSGNGEEGPGQGGFVMLSWKAADPNEDQLEFSLFFRRAGTQTWVPILDKPIRENKYRWVTHGVPDGQYQVKVVASDLPSNPAATAREDSRITDTFTIDNTAPIINNFRLVERKDGKVVLAADPVDALSRLASASVKLSSTTESQRVMPADGIWDQRSESLKFTVDLSDRSAGTCLVILTVTDSANNLASAAIEVVKP